MIPRAFFVLAIGVALAACQPAVPDSGRGVGFDDSARAQRQARDSVLARNVPAPAAVSSAPLSAVNDGSAEATAAETARVLAATRPGSSSQEPVL